MAESTNVEKSLYDNILAEHSHLNVSRVLDNTFTVLDRSDFAIVTSGTATLETAIMEKPMIISYKTSFLSAFIFRIFVNLPHIGLVNIIAGKEVVPEMLQYDATPNALAKKVLEIINDDSNMRKMKEELRKVHLTLGEKGASRRTADAVVRFIRERNI
jgi:lipid-A-disaccharide synthase